MTMKEPLTPAQLVAQYCLGFAKNFLLDNPEAAAAYIGIATAALNEQYDIAVNLINKLITYEDALGVLIQHWGSQRLSLKLSEEEQ